MANDIDLGWLYIEGKVRGFNEPRYAVRGVQAQIGALAYTLAEYLAKNSNQPVSRTDLTMTLTAQGQPAIMPARIGTAIAQLKYVFVEKYGAHKANQIFDTTSGDAIILKSFSADFVFTPEPKPALKTRFVSSAALPDDPRPSRRARRVEADDEIEDEDGGDDLRPIDELMGETPAPAGDDEDDDSPAPAAPISAVPQGDDTSDADAPTIDREPVEEEEEEAEPEAEAVETPAEPAQNESAAEEPVLAEPVAEEPTVEEPVEETSTPAPASAPAKKKPATKKAQPKKPSVKKTETKKPDIQKPATSGKTARLAAQFAHAARLPAETDFGPFKIAYDAKSRNAQIIGKTSVPVGEKMYRLFLTWKALNGQAAETLPMAGAFFGGKTPTSSYYASVARGRAFIDKATGKKGFGKKFIPQNETGYYIDPTLSTPGKPKP